MIVRDSGKHCGSPKGVLGVGFFESLKHNAPGSEKPSYHRCPKNRTAKTAVTPRRAITYSGRQITRSPLLVPYANPRPGSGSQRAEFMLTCLLWSAGIGYRTLKTLWNNNRRLLDRTIQGRRAKEAQTNAWSPCRSAAGQGDMSLYRMLQETTNPATRVSCC